MRKAPFVLRRHAITYVHSATAWQLQRSLLAGRREKEKGGILVLADPESPVERNAVPAEASEAPELAFASVRAAGFGRLPHTRREALSIAQVFAGGTSLLESGPRPGWKLEVGGREAPAKEFQDVLKAAGGLDPAVRDVSLSGPGILLLLGNLAKRSALTAPDAGLERHRFIHVAAHGLAHPENPGLSGMILSPGEEDSGFLRLMDVMNLELGADLVTLSACETQLGKSTSAEGFQGLVRAFLYAGVGTVIASSWRVPDRESGRLLPGVYRFLRKGGVSPGEALRKAQIAYLDAIPADAGRSASPHFWGAWTAWGAGGW